MELEELITAGTECLKDGSFEEGIAVLSLVLGKDYWDAKVVNHLAQAYRAIGDAERARQHFAELVEYYSSVNDYTSAISCQAEILDIYRDDIVSIAKLGDLFVAGGKPNSAIEEYRRALKLISFSEASQQYIEVAEKLVALAERDLKQREDLIDKYLQVEDKDSALEHLSKLALLYAGKGDYKASIELYHKMVSLAPEDMEFSRKLEQMVDMEGKRRSKRLKVVRICVLLVLLFSILGIVLGYVLHARTQYFKIEIEAEKLAAEGKYNEASQKIQDFFYSFPFSPMSGKVKRKMQEYDTLAKNLTREKLRKKKEREEKAINEAKRFAEAIPQSDRLVEVEKLLNEVNALLKSAEYDEQKRILTEVQLKLKGIDAKIEKLIQQANRELSQGNFTAAHSLFVAILDGYHASSKVAALQIPVRVECKLPSVADVFVNGKPAGSTPVVLRLEPEEEVKVVIKAEGFEPYEELLRPKRKGLIVTTLERAAFWSKKFAASKIFETKALFSEAGIVCVTRDGEILILSPENGELKDTLSLDKLTSDSTTVHDITANPIVKGSIMYLPSLDGSLYAINLVQKKIIWTFKTSDFLRASPVLAYNPLLGKDVLIFGSDNGFLYCLNSLDGKQMWQYKAKEAIISSPVIVGGYVFFTCRDGKLYKLTLARGELIKKVMTSSAISSSPVVKGDKLFFGNDDGDLYVIKHSDLSILHCVPVGGGKIRTAPLFFGNFLIVTGSPSSPGTKKPSHVTILDMNGWRTVSQVSLTGLSRTRPIVFKDLLLCASSDGYIYCYKFSKENGELASQLWMYDVGSRIVAEPSSNGRIVVFPVERGRVIAFQ